MKLPRNFYCVCPFCEKWKRIICYTSKVKGSLPCCLDCAVIGRVERGLID